MGIYRGQVRDVLSLPVWVSLPEEESRTLQWLGQRVPPPEKVQLVLDTGSRRSTLRPQILALLRCTPGLKKGQIQTATGQGTVNYFEVRMEFVACSLTALPRVVVAGLGMPAILAAYDGVIGRDILNRWEIFYSGLRQRLTVRDHSSVWGWLCS